ncbi:MAG: S4 domain-containing protein [Candidatus Micrarchaeaceae archaeon]
MANKGNSRHLKRLAASRYTKVKRKAYKYLKKPDPGRHTLESSIALITVVTEKLGLANNAREAKRIIKNGLIEVNGRAIKSTGYPIGLEDVLHVKPENKHYRVSVGKGGTFLLSEINESDAALQTLKVLGKYTAKNGAIMLRLHNGNVIAGKPEIKVNDSVVLEHGSIKSVIKFEKGALCRAIKGVNAPETGRIANIKPGTSKRAAMVEVESQSGNFETSIDNIMVIGA